VIPDRQSVRLHVRYAVNGPPGVLTVDAALFPYDTAHQTFLNLYDGDALTQAILDHGRTRFEYFAGTRQGTLAVVRKFVPAGIHHILIGPDHLLFLIGLLLLGGTIRQLATVVTAFTVAHSITLSLAALNLVSPPARIIEPAIALSIVYVGADNLLVREGRDVRAWIAFTFGFIHGFGFANVLREMDLPPRALGWSLFSFNVGVEIGQLLVVVTVAYALQLLRSRSEAAGRGVATAFVIDSRRNRWWGVEAPAGWSVAAFDPGSPGTVIVSDTFPTGSGKAVFGPADGYGARLPAPFASVPVLPSQNPTFPYCSFCDGLTGMGAILFQPNGTASFAGTLGGSSAQGQQFTVQSPADGRTVLLAVIGRTGILEVFER
jgi:hydrogenase/urease accessory protein HupE